MNCRQGKRRSIGVMGAGVLAGYCLLLGSAAARAQSGTGMDSMQINPPMSSTGHTLMPMDRPTSSMEARMGARARMERNIERQKRLESYTRRLLALANELKTEVASSGTEAMTPEMRRKMDEIEKLARGVKDKMRD